MIKQLKIGGISLILAGGSFYAATYFIPNKNVAFFLGMAVFSAIFFSVCATLKPYISAVFALLPGIAYFLFPHTPFILPIAAAIVNLLILLIIYLLMHRLQFGAVLSVIAAFMIRFALMQLYLRFLMPEPSELYMAITDPLTALYAVPHLTALLLGAVLSVFLIPAYRVFLSDPE